MGVSVTIYFIYFVYMSIVLHLLGQNKWVWVWVWVWVILLHSFHCCHFSLLPISSRILPIFLLLLFYIPPKAVFPILIVVYPFSCGLALSLPLLSLVVGPPPSTPSDPPISSSFLLFVPFNWTTAQSLSLSQCIYINHWNSSKLAGCWCNGETTSCWEYSTGFLK